MPLAPASTLLARCRNELVVVLREHQVDEATIATECAETSNYCVAATASRSIIGSMNEFAFLADAHRQEQADLDLLDLSMEFSTVPCGPLYRSHISPDRELRALLVDTSRTER